VRKGGDGRQDWSFGGFGRLLKTSKVSFSEYLFITY
jgi:hypothetical protein